MNYKKIDNNNQSGQAIVESFFSIIILLFCVFSVIEIARLLSFKNYINTIVVECVQSISYSHLSLKKQGLINSQEKYTLNNKKEIFESNLNKYIKSEIKKFPTSLLSFDNNINTNNNLLVIKEQYVFVDLKLIENSNYLKNPNGVYLKINVCLPVLFSSLFRNIDLYYKSKSKIGKKINTTLESDSSHNCLGYFSYNSFYEPLFWFRVRSAAYFPWPASSSIYENGFSMNNDVIGIYKQYRYDLSKLLNKVNIDDFMNQVQNEQRK
ncbi:hypothetical protein [Spirobacillus cienkowskii]|uniref:hypothetical protein n=1 Tax=Spirobacillus cienkowskii TaxID=495820 RepID=UPI0030D5013E